MWLKRPKSERAKKQEERSQAIHRIFLRSRMLYGSPKIMQTLRSQGHVVSQKTVARFMKEKSLRSRTVKKYKATTNSKHTLPVSDNVLNQQFTARSPNEVWMADITYVPTQEGWLYVASISPVKLSGGRRVNR